MLLCPFKMLLALEGIIRDNTKLRLYIILLFPVALARETAGQFCTEAGRTLLTLEKKTQAYRCV